MCLLIRYSPNKTKKGTSTAPISLRQPDLTETFHTELHLNDFNKIYMYSLYQYFTNIMMNKTNFIQPFYQTIVYGLDCNRNLYVEAPNVHKESL